VWIGFGSKQVADNRIEMEKRHRVCKFLMPHKEDIIPSWS